MIGTKVPMKAALNPQQLNLLIQCAELNLKYTEGLGECFDFYPHVDQNPQPAAVPVGTELVVRCPAIAASLHDWTTEWFLLAQISDVNLAAEFHPNDKKVLRISARHVAVFDRNSEKQKAIAIHHKDPANVFATDGADHSIFPSGNIFLIEDIEVVLEISFLGDPCNTKNISCNVAVSNQQVVFRANTILLLLQYIAAASPNFLLLPYKPNKC